MHLNTSSLKLDEFNQIKLFVWIFLQKWSHPMKGSLIQYLLTIQIGWPQILSPVICPFHSIDSFGKLNPSIFNLKISEMRSILALALLSTIAAFTIRKFRFNIIRSIKENNFKKYWNCQPKLIIPSLVKEISAIGEQRNKRETDGKIGGSAGIRRDPPEVKNQLFSLSIKILGWEYFKTLTIPGSTNPCWCETMEEEWAKSSSTQTWT